MPDLDHLLKLAHILGAAVLFGTGTGIAFFMLMAHRSRNVSAIAPTATIVVITDAVFTASAVVVQPFTGIALAHVAGYSLFDSWIVVSVALYLRRIVLAAGALVPEAHARSGHRGSAQREATAGGIRPVFSLLVHSRLAGLRGHDRNLLADDSAPATLVNQR